MTLAPSSNQYWLLHPAGWGPTAYTSASQQPPGAHLSYTDNSTTEQQQSAQWAMEFLRTGKNSEHWAKRLLVQAGKRFSVDTRLLHITEAQITAKFGLEYLLLGYLLASHRIFFKYIYKPYLLAPTTSATPRNYADSSLLRSLADVKEPNPSQSLQNLLSWCDRPRAASAAHAVQSFPGGLTSYTNTAERGKDLDKCHLIAWWFVYISLRVWIWFQTSESTSPHISIAQGGHKFRDTAQVWSWGGLHPDLTHKTNPMLKAMQVPKLTGPRFDFFLQGKKLLNLPLVYSRR